MTASAQPVVKPRPERSSPSFGPLELGEHLRRSLDALDLRVIGTPEARGWITTPDRHQEDAMFQVTITGNVTRDAQLRFTQAGQKVTNLTIAHNSRVKTPNGWVDGNTLYVEVTAWDQMAENIAETLTRGDAVQVTGDMTVGDEPGSDGVTRTKIRLRPTSICLSIRAKRAERSTAGEPAEDPWSTAASTVSSVLGGTPVESPF